MNIESKNPVLLKELTDLIQKGNAHVSLDEAIAGLTVAQLTITPDRLPYNIWQLTEHIRITQWDIVEFCIHPDHQSPKWPDEYWVDANESVTMDQWKETLNRIQQDRERFLKLLQAPSTDLYTPFPHGTGQNLLREALLIADHNAYHIAEIIVIRRLLNSWK